MEPVTLKMNAEGQIADCDFVQWIMNEIEDKAYTRADVAKTYSILLQKATPLATFVRINEAIIKRWSPSALRWIKEQAWKKTRAS